MQIQGEFYLVSSRFFTLNSLLIPQALITRLPIDSYIAAVFSISAKDYYNALNQETCVSKFLPSSAFQRSGGYARRLFTP